MEKNIRQIQKELTRKRILQSAYEVYSCNGFGATTNMIAKEAHISHGNIFVHFPTVADLQICLLEQFGTDINIQLHELSENNSSLKDFLHAHVEIIMKHENFYRRLVTENSLIPEQANYVYISIQSSVSFHLSQVIEKYQNDKKIKMLPIHFIFNTWLGILHYYLSNQELFAPEGSVLNRHKEELVNNFLILLTI